MVSRGTQSLQAVLCSALLLVVGCGSDTTVVLTTGSLTIGLQMTGTSPDPDGCLVSVDDTEERVLMGGESASIDGLSEGLHVVVLSDVAPHCTLQGEAVRSVVVGLDQPATLEFVVNCPAPSSIEVMTRTTGSGIKPNGYAVEVDWTDLQQASLTDTLVFSHLSSGEHVVKLSAGNTDCTVLGENPRTVVLVEGETTSIDFISVCPPFYDHIAFVSSRNGDYDIGIMASDGSNQVMLKLDAARTLESPAWSPDGTGLVYNAFSGPSQGSAWGDIYVIDFRGAPPVNLTPGPARGSNPAWSPDGQRIASSIDGDIWVMDTDGSNRVNLTGLFGESAENPAWSPGGDRLAFDAGGIFVMEADGSNPTEITDDIVCSWACRWPAWSPDGSRIAFASYEQGIHKLYTIDADGSNPIPLTAGEYCAHWPSWSPDGSEIAIESYRDGWDIYMLQSDGSGEIRLTDVPSIDMEPAWSPGP